VVPTYNDFLDYRADPDGTICSLNPVTISIPTKDRPTQLASLIISLLNQTNPNWSLSIVDDSETRIEKFPYVRNLLNHLSMAGHQWNVIYGSKEGPPQSHNKVMNTAKSEWVLVMGDDNLLNPNYLENIIAESVIANLDVAGGVYLHPEFAISMDRVGYEDGVHLLDHRTKESNPLQWALNHDMITKLTKNPLYSGFLYRRDVLRAVGGFPTYLSPVAHREETITGLSISKCGYRLGIVPTAIAWHVRTFKGGIHTNSNPKEYWKLDEQKYQKFLDGVVKVKPDFDDIWERMKGVDGWLSREEAQVLYAKTALGDANQIVVEIGTHRGRSTALLALANPDSKIITVDPYTEQLSLNSPYSNRHTERIDCGEVSRKEFVKNMNQLGIKNYEQIISTSQEASGLLKFQIDTLYIDGMHDIKNVTQDYDLWAPKVKAGGCIILHDVNDSCPDVKAFAHANSFEVAFGIGWKYKG